MVDQLSNETIKWLTSGERGLSSEAMFSRFTGIPINRWTQRYPHDPDDFQRCEKLLRAVPEFRAKLPKMAEVSQVWARLVAHWQEIVDSLEAEVPGLLNGTTHTGRAPKTYDLMRRVMEAQP